MNKKKRSLDRGYRQPSIYSRTEANSPRHNIKKGVLSTLLIIFLLGSGYILLFTSLFKIEETKINQLKYADGAEIKKTVDDYQNSLIFQDNLLFLLSGSLEEKILVIPGVKEAKVIKEYPHALRLEVTEKTPSLVWQTQNERFLLDENGVAYGNYEDKYADIQLVIDVKNVPIESGKKIVTREFCSFVLGVGKYFSQSTGEEIKAIETMESAGEIRVVTESNWLVYFDVSREVKGELNNLNQAITEIKKNNKKITYIDLRIENKIFYK